MKKSLLYTAMSALSAIAEDKSSSINEIAMVNEMLTTLSGDAPSVFKTETEPKAKAKTEPKVKAKAKAKVEPKKDIIELIDGFKAGTHTLLPAPICYLRHLDPNKARKYMSGINLQEVITSKAIVQASKQGILEDFVQSAYKAQGDKSVKVTNPIEIVAGDKVDKFLQPRIKAVKDGEALWKYMSRKGIDQEVVMDFAKVAEAMYHEQSSK